MKRRQEPQGFTLIELLISIALMMILIVAVTMIFVNTTETVAVQEARMTVYTNARYAMDIMENDLMGAFGLNEPPRPASQMGAGAQYGGGTYIPGDHIPQAFWMDNGELPRAGAVTRDGDGELPKMNGSADPKAHFERAGDAIGFRSVTTVADTLQTCEVTYLLIPGDHVLDTAPPGSSSPINRPMSDISKLLQPGDASHTRTARTQRPLYTLVRRVRMQNPQQQQNAQPVFDQIPQVKDKQGNMVTVQDQELCYYVVSFNLEYLASNRAFSQLAPSPFPHEDPLGNGSGANDAAGTAYRVPAIRVTMRVVEDVGERQERTIQKVMWIPQQ
ncbi:MAG TPA: prepilin-type N-terminal cleavage/methylation domain-containing protein [Planctomycetota bacterium]|nr:prepilin-type N-terminal cleavage/methylation domain-containing protein [Planctomycetota bacterium]